MLRIRWHWAPATAVSGVTQSPVTHLSVLWSSPAAETLVKRLAAWQHGVTYE